MKTTLRFLKNAIPLALVCTGAQAGQRPHGRPPPIPPSAYSACVGKSIGDNVNDGHMDGTCQKAPNGKLALRPNGPPPHGPPPEQND